MVRTFVGMFRGAEPRDDSDVMSPEDRARIRAAAARARRRLQEAGLLDVEKEAQREIRARVQAA